MSRVWHRASRPRVAVINLNERDSDRIESLCGEMRRAESWADYTSNWSASETDLLVVVDPQSNPRQAWAAIPVLAIGDIQWAKDARGRDGAGWASVESRERELVGCVDDSSPFADATEQLLAACADEPPPILSIRYGHSEHLVATATGKSVAMLYYQDASRQGETTGPPALVVPHAADPVVWLRAMIALLHDVDSEAFPHRPPKLSKAEDWYTANERAIANEIAGVEAEIVALGLREAELRSNLSDATRLADEQERATLFADGDELVEAVIRLLEALGFDVLNIDATVSDGEPRREDLHVREPSDPWIAIAEVKGYTRGCKTNDLRQMRDHRDAYIAATRASPHRTWWIANHERSQDPSTRTRPGADVIERAQLVEVVTIPTIDLYRLWQRVDQGTLDAASARSLLRSAEPGVWSLDGS